MYDKLEYPFVKAFMEAHVGNLRKEASLRLLQESAASTDAQRTRLQRFTAKVTAYLKSFSLNVSELGTRIN